tara:strand:+ start:814 stop:2088 length:1275 start_codon:yes stop_codon:yes gene_type:complete
MSCQEKKECICCGKENLEAILDLLDQPLANSYHRNDEEQSVFPLRLNLCHDCYHLQLSHIVDPDLMFKDYLYVSGTTKTLRDYFSWFADFAYEATCRLNWPDSAPHNVLDIACNDGSQLDAFKAKGLKTFGVDPAINLHNLSSKKHTVLRDYFSADSISGWMNDDSTGPSEIISSGEPPRFSIIVAQNVFAHNENALKFLEDCKELMHLHSLLLIQVSQADMIRENQFDTIYHEHISFFSINSFNELAKRAGLHVVDVIKTPIHGGSYVFMLSPLNALMEQRIKNLLELERSRGLQSKETYYNYANKCKNITTNFKTTIKEYRNNGYKIIGYGAAAKGNTLLNFADETLDYIVDDNPLKHNLYTPGKNILITSPDKILELQEDDKVLFVPLAWNFFKEIKTNILRRRDNKNDKFLSYFPEIKVS